MRSRLDRTGNRDQASRDRLRTAHWHRLRRRIPERPLAFLGQRQSLRKPWLEAKIPEGRSSGEPLRAGGDSLFVDRLCPAAPEFCNRNNELDTNAYAGASQIPFQFHAAAEGQQRE